VKILLLNIDSKLPNIALHKIAMWHEQQGDEVVWGSPIEMYGADKVYASCIFTKSREKMLNYMGLRSDLIGGGTGYDLNIKLPAEIDAMKPKINYGFTTRGCIRDCKFCFVPKSEGNFRIVGDLYDIWNGVSKSVTFFDNNILASPEHFEKICSQASKEGVSVDFNQGLDIRLLSERVCVALNNVSLTNGVRFAFDYPQLEKIVREKVALLREHYKRKYIFFYVLVGFDTTFEDDLYRCNVLRELECRPYVMCHENTPKEKRYVRLAEWCNQFWTFAKYDFDTFCVEYEKKV